MPLGELTEKQKRFAEEYLIHGNATKAAEVAGYSVRTAKRAGYANLKKTKIREYLKRRIDAMDAERVAKADEVLRYLTSVMRGESESEITVIERCGSDSRARQIKKRPDEKERLKAAEALGKRLGLWDGSGKQPQSSEALEALLALMEKQNADN